MIHRPKENYSLFEFHFVISHVDVISDRVILQNEGTKN